MNIVEIIKGQLTSSGAMSKLASSLGMDAGDARRATDAAVPTMLAGLTGLADTSDGARKLDTAVNDIDDDEDPITSLTSGGGRFIDKGGSMLSSLFGGGMLSNIASALSKFTGMGSGQITSLLGGLTPIVLGVLKGQKKSLGLDAGGLANMLSSQKSNIAGAMPAGLSGALGSVPGMSGLGDWMKGAGAKATGAAGDAADWAKETGERAVDRTREMAGSAYESGRAAVSGTAHHAASAGSSTSRWAIPVIALLAAGALLWWWAASNRSRTEQARVAVPATPQNRVADDARDTSDAARDATADAGRAVDSAARDATGAARDAGAAVGEQADATLAAAKTAGNQSFATLQTNITDTFTAAGKTMSGITDAASAEKALPALKAMPKQLKSIQTGLSALPSDSQSKLSATLRTSTQTLNAGIEKAMAIPGVADKIRPHVAPIQEQLKAFAPTTQPAASSF